MYSLVTMFFLDISTLLDYFQDNIIVPMRVKAVLRSFMRSVFLISFGITTLPKSSILLTIPVAFMQIYSFCIYYDNSITHFLENMRGFSKFDDYS